MSSKEKAHRKPQLEEDAPAAEPSEKVVEAERRRWPRIDLRKKGMVAAWQAGSQRQASFVDSVSLNGIFVLTSVPPPLGTVVKLLVETPSGDVRARAIVRRIVAGQGMGLAYVSMDYQDRTRLYRLFKSVAK